MTLRELIENVQIRDGVEINVLDGEYFQKDKDSWVEVTGKVKCVFKTKKGTDFRHVLTLDEIWESDEDYLDYEVYAITALNTKNKFSIDIKKKEDK